MTPRDEDFEQDDELEYVETIVESEPEAEATIDGKDIENLALGIAWQAVELGREIREIHEKRPVADDAGEVALLLLRIVTAGVESYGADWLTACVPQLLGGGGR